MSKIPTDDLNNIMTCARWLVREFEKIHCPSLANLFQKAVDDAESWILHMKDYGHLSTPPSEAAMQKEAELIRDLLMRYANIKDPEIRTSFIQGMLSSLELTHLKKRSN